MNRLLRLAATLTCLLWAIAFAQLELHFIDVGQGDAVLIVSPSGQTVLYDGGRAGDTALAYQPPFYLDNGQAATTQVFARLADAQVLPAEGQRIGLGDAASVRRGWQTLKTRA